MKREIEERNASIGGSTTYKGERRKEGFSSAPSSHFPSFFCNNIIIIIYNIERRRTYYIQSGNGIEIEPPKLISKGDRKISPTIMIRNYKDTIKEIFRTRSITIGGNLLQYYTILLTKVKR